MWHTRPSAGSGAHEAKIESEDAYHKGGRGGCYGWTIARKANRRGYRHSERAGGEALQAFVENGAVAAQPMPDRYAFEEFGFFHVPDAIATKVSFHHFPLLKRWLNQWQLLSALGSELNVQNVGEFRRV